MFEGKGGTMRKLLLGLVLAGAAMACGGAASEGFSSAVPTPTPRPLLPPLAPGEVERIRQDRFSVWTDTDLSRSTVPLKEINLVPFQDVGILYPDQIPPVYNPVFHGVSEADEVLDSQEPVLAVEVEGEAKAYPMRVLVWHEVVNDEIAGRPILATY